MVRIFVGGLDGDVTQELLSTRFTSFGRVTACSIILRKEADPLLQLPTGPANKSSGAICNKWARNTSQRSTPGCRGFAYVDFEPKDAAALHRCLSLYNGCKWRGGVLRVEPALPKYSELLQEEWEDDAATEHNSAMTIDEMAAAALVPASTKALRMTRADTGRVVASVAEPGPGSRTLFPPFRQIPFRDISWSLD